MIIYDNLFEKSKNLVSYNECQNFREVLYVVFQIKSFKDYLDCSMCCLIKNQSHNHIRIFNNLFERFSIFYRLK